MNISSGWMKLLHRRPIVDEDCEEHEGQDVRELHEVAQLDKRYFCSGGWHLAVAEFEEEVMQHLGETLMASKKDDAKIHTGHWQADGFHPTQKSEVKVVKVVKVSKSKTKDDFDRLA
jgi:hypothetical protein